jgi:hypothetical protein
MTCSPRPLTPQAACFCTASTFGEEERALFSLDAGELLEHFGYEAT